MSADRLREMLSEATSGKWHQSGKRVVEMRHRSTIAVVSEHYGSEADARLVALAPDAIALLADMGEAAEEYRFAVRPDPRDYHERQAANDFDAVLARFATFTRDSDA